MKSINGSNEFLAQQDGIACIHKIVLSLLRMTIDKTK